MLSSELIEGLRALPGPAEGVRLREVCGTPTRAIAKAGLRRLLPEGVEDYGNENADALLSLLADGGVNTLDLRPALSSTPEQAEETFFRTDHHWNYTAAFTGTQLILDQLRALFPQENFNFQYADLSLWEAHTYADWFLGTHGKRTGPYYGGTDDITYYTPGFETDILYINPSEREVLRGDFAETIVHSEKIDERDYYNTSPYCVYIGADYPLVLIRNPGAPNDLRLLLIKDSFTLPLMGYLSTMFQEIDVIDPRYSSLNIAEYVQYRQPDLVVQMLFPRTQSDNPEEFDYGSIAEANVRHTVLEPQDVTVSEEDSAHILPLALERGQSYLLRFDGIEFTAGAAGGTIVGLFEAGAANPLVTGAFDLEYGRENGFEWFFTVPDDAGENLELRFCAGIPEISDECAAIYRGVQLEAIG